MGYTTDFEGSFKTDKPVHDSIYELINGLQETRRMKRSGLDKKYGVEGEFYYEDTDDCCQTHEPSLGKIVNYNSPPSTQPSLWLQWIMSEDKQTIKWDGNEKFYYYVEWIEYIIKNILEPNGYKLNGEVEFQGEEMRDRGLIIIINNKVSIENVFYKKG
jgi:hypothetical protein